MFDVANMRKDNRGSMEGVTISPVTPQEISNNLRFLGYQGGAAYLDGLGGMVVESIKRGRHGETIIDRSTFRVETPHARVFASFNRYGNSCWDIVVCSE